MTEKCRKLLEHKQGAMEEARVKAVLPVPKTSPSREGAAEQSETLAPLLWPSDAELSWVFFNPRGNNAREAKSFMLEPNPLVLACSKSFRDCEKRQMSSLGD